LAFCDGDDLVDPDWLNALTAARARGSVVGGHLEEELLSVPGQENWRPPATPGGLPSFLDHPYPVSANMGVDRLVFEKLGGFVENLTRGEDMAFGFSVSNAGETLVYAPEAIVHYRHRAGFRSMLEQHYLYGIGMSEIISRGLLPTTGGRDASGMRSLRPNGQRVERPSVAQFARRGSIAVGRVVGLIKERRRNNTTA
jgi:cellulose synthase/poly-beta-1,6-N-acetylglucosamine synthase-like glycosyltransferase